MRKIYQSRISIFCEGYRVVFNEFYTEHKKPAGAGLVYFGSQLFNSQPLRLYHHDHRRRQNMS